MIFGDLLLESPGAPFRCLVIRTCTKTFLADHGKKWGLLDETEGLTAKVRAHLHVGRARLQMQTRTVPPPRNINYGSPSHKFSYLFSLFFP